MKYQFRIMKIKCYQVGRIESPGVPVLATVPHVWQPCSKQPTDMGGPRRHQLQYSDKSWSKVDTLFYYSPVIFWKGENQVLFY